MFETTHTIWTTANLYQGGGGRGEEEEGVTHLGSLDRAPPQEWTSSSPRSVRTSVSWWPPWGPAREDCPGWSTSACSPGTPGHLADSALWGSEDRVQSNTPYISTATEKVWVYVCRSWIITTKVWCLLLIVWWPTLLLPSRTTLSIILFRFS